MLSSRPLYNPRFHTKVVRRVSVDMLIYEHGANEESQWVLPVSKAACPPDPLPDTLLSGGEHRPPMVEPFLRVTIQAQIKSLRSS